LLFPSLIPARRAGFFPFFRLAQVGDLARRSAEICRFRPVGKSGLSVNCVNFGVTLPVLQN